MINSIPPRSPPPLLKDACQNSFFRFSKLHINIEYSLPRLAYRHLQRILRLGPRSFSAQSLRFKRLDKSCRADQLLARERCTLHQGSRSYDTALLMKPLARQILCGFEDAHGNPVSQNKLVMFEFCLSKQATLSL